ncbi:MAG: stage II sporulation protein P [Oscillospiraceae bacterium]|nr:stage II sporulation protein P [Oscillospiraceae bacterium]
MDRKIRLRAAILVCLLIFCLQSGVLNMVAAALSQDEVLSMLLFLQTGRMLHSVQPDPTVPEMPAQTQPATTAPTAPPATPTFSPDELVDVQYFCDYRPDLEALLTKKTDLSLRSDDPTVLIVHSHATESYAGTDGYRSLDEQENMIAIGSEIARVLEDRGIPVLHDKTCHDHPDYDSYYANARSTIRGYLEEYPSIQMVLDIHRDASDDTAGQLITSATVGGQKSAQLMMVVGTDAGGNHHPDWQDNLSLALKLSAVLEQENPGICRPVSLRSERFNMDLTAGSLLVEVGAAGNTLQEARIAANALAQAIAALADGA